MTSEIRLFSALLQLRTERIIAVSTRVSNVSMS